MPSNNTDINHYRKAAANLNKLHGLKAQLQHLLKLLRPERLSKIVRTAIMDEIKIFLCRCSSKTNYCISNIW